MLKNKNFALIGAAGYVAPRHMRAINDTDNKLVAALDRSDSVGVMDRFSQDVAFFTEFERFDRHAEKLRRRGESDRLHYVSICSPNYLHDAHIRFALRVGADAICEKPLVLNPWNLDALSEFERESGRRIFNILQLRLHPSILALKEKIEQRPNKKKYDIDLAYITSRGKWYFTSWKGDSSKSGGIASNIGIHFFDMLTWIFGSCIRHRVHVSEDRRMAGMLELESANVRWFLSIDRNDLPLEVASKGKTTYRSIKVNGDELEFSEGFGDLHTILYQDIMSGGGFGLEDARHSVELVYELRNSEIMGASGDDLHPLVAG
jgi:UDP-N-acetyl-2-amino-2-deoxyglucuronate dehydrogenase